MIPSGQNRVSRTRVAALYRRYSEELLAFIRSELPIAKVDAADVLHTVFIELLKWHDNNPGRAIDSPRGFVYKVASRHLGKYVDKTRRTPSSSALSSPADDLELRSVVLGDDVDFMAGLSEARRPLLRAMRRLGDPTGSAQPVPLLQRIVYLKFWVGMTEAEIGEVVDLPRGTVARRLRKAKAELLVRLQEFEQQKPGSTRTSTTLIERWWKQLTDQSE